MAINKYNAEVIFADTANVKAKTVLKNIPVAVTPDLSKLLTLVTAMKAISNAGIFSYSLLGWESAAFAGTATPEGLNTIKAMVSLEWLTSGVKNFRNIYIPNPGQTVVEMVAGQGVRMTAAALTAISNAITASAGFAVTATEGKIVVKSWKKDSSPRGTCIGFKDENNNVCYMTIPTGLCTNAAALVTLCTALQPAGVSGSKIVENAFLTKTEAIPDPAEGIGLPAADEDKVEFSSVETRMRTSHSYVVGTLRKYEHAIIPAPIFTSCVGSGDGYKLDPTEGATLAAALSVFLGETKTLSYAGSKLKSKNLQPQ